MNTLTDQISPDGPLVKVRIGFGATAIQSLRQQGRAIPGPIDIMALIDSGAEVTCIDKHSLAPLVARGLTFRRFVFANIPALGGLIPSSEYVTSVTLVHPADPARSGSLGRDVAILEQSLGALGYQAVIGRDILDRCLFIYDGPSKSFTLGY